MTKYIVASRKKQNALRKLQSRRFTISAKRPITKNGQTVYIDCDRCSGKGYLPSYYNENCSVCSGSGYDGYETISNTCSRCSGSGKSTQTDYTKYR